MIRDTLRAVLVVAVVAACAAITVETFFQLAAIDVARRGCHTPAMAQHQPAPPTAEPGRLRRFGRAALELADAAVGVVR